MYERHFGLKNKLFPSAMEEKEVFVGPRTATAVASLKAALIANDAVVTVSGPVGSGKTTLVLQALASVDTKHIIVRVARMRLSSNDVLELLLDELGLRRLPNGAIQRFSAFRKRLQELENDGTRIFVVVEDGLRLGADTIAELEALTAADAGESRGAGIVLMGDEELAGFLLEPLLARCRQRIRHRHIMTPLKAADFSAYLEHCFRLAGGDIANIFNADSIRLLHELSAGIPRVANNLIESVLSTAAEQGLEQIPVQLLATVAREEYGLSDNDTVIAAENPEPAAIPNNVVEPQTESPEFIEDTLPNLSILSPQPEQQKDATLAELRPDLDALEKAMAATACDDPVENSSTPPTEPPEPDGIPEITLDVAIEEKLEAIPAAKTAPKQDKADPEIAKIATGLANAKSLEDMDDKMAETLFGEEFSSIAAQIATPPADPDSANDDVEPQPAVQAAKPVKAAPKAPVNTAMSATASQRLRTVRALNEEIPAPPKTVEVPTAIEPAQEETAPGSVEDQINTSMTQTLETLKLRPPEIDDEDDQDTEESKGGFFSRFKRS